MTTCALLEDGTKSSATTSPSQALAGEREKPPHRHSAALETSNNAGLVEIDVSSAADQSSAVTDVDMINVGGTVEGYQP